jgi:hypothetical protein
MSLIPLSKRGKKTKKLEQTLEELDEKGLSIRLGEDAIELKRSNY